MMAPKQQPQKAAAPQVAKPQKSPPTPAKEAAKITENITPVATPTNKKGGAGAGDNTGMNTSVVNASQPQAKPRRISELPVNVGNKVAQPVVNPFDLPTNIGGKGLQPSVKPLDLPTNVGNKVAQPAVNPFDLPVNVGNKVAQPVVKPLALPNDIGGKAPVKSGLPAQQMVTPSSGGNVAGIKATTAAAVKVTGAKDAVVATPVGAEQTPAAEAATATPASAKDNPAFAALTGNIAETASAQKRHESAGRASRKGQAAAKAPAGEQLQTAQANQAEAMDQAEAKSFNTESFKAMLTERISQMKMPKNEEEADDFDKHTNVGEINQQAVGDVTAVKGEAVGEVENTSNATPDTGSVPVRKVAAMPKVKSGAKPAIGNVAKAMPSKRSAAEIEQPMAKEANKPDQALQEAGVSDHVLATSNEPSFTKALNAKETAKTQSQQATEDLRASEAAKQEQTQADAQAATNAQLAGMHGARVSGLNAVAGQQKAGAKANSAERKAVIDKVNSIFTSTQTAVNTALNGLDTEVTKLFDTGAKEAKQVFEDYTEKEMQAYKDKRYGDAWYDLRNIRRIGDAVAGLPEEVNNIYVLGRDEYIKALDSHITTIAEKVTAALTEAQNAIATGKQELKEYVDGLGPDLKALGQESASNIQSKFDRLEQDIADKQDSLIDTLADKYNSSVAEIDEDIAQRKEANKGLVGKAMSAIQGVIEFYNKIKALFDSLLTNVAAAGAAIMADPIGFAKNLFSGVGQGISNFMNNIGQHLQTGLIGWLTGASASLGITMPDNLFSAKGIFSLVTQVLGLSWNAVRGIGAQVIGERTMGILEKGFNLVMILKNEGITGLWEHLKESFINLKDQVIGQIKDMVITTVINAGMKWLLSLMNPAGALVKIVMGIVKVVQFIIERAASILELVDAFVQSIGAIAKGDVGAVAKNIEEALKRGIPLLIGMLANFLGLGSIAKKVSKMLKSLRKPIVKGIKKLWMKLKQMGRSVLRKLKKKFKRKGKKEDEHDKKQGEALEDTTVGKTVFFEADKEKHQLWVTDKGGIDIMVASKPLSAKERIKKWYDRIEGLSEEEEAEARTLLGKAETQYGETLNDAVTADKLMNEAQKENASEDTIEKAEKKDEQVENEQLGLKETFKRLFEIFGDHESEHDFTVKRIAFTKNKTKNIQTGEYPERFRRDMNRFINVLPALDVKNTPLRQKHISTEKTAIRKWENYEGAIYSPFVGEYQEALGDLRKKVEGDKFIITTETGGSFLGDVLVDGTNIENVKIEKSDDGKHRQKQPKIIVEKIRDRMSGNRYANSTFTIVEPTISGGAVRSLIKSVSEGVFKDFPNIKLKFVLMQETIGVDPEEYKSKTESTRRRNVKEYKLSNNQIELHYADTRYVLGEDVDNHIDAKSKEPLILFKSTDEILSAYQIVPKGGTNTRKLVIALGNGELNDKLHNVL